MPMGHNWEKEEKIGTAAASSGYLSQLSAPPPGTHWIYGWFQAPPAGDKQANAVSKFPVGFVYQIMSLFVDGGAAGWSRVPIPLDSDGNATGSTTFAPNTTYAALVMVSSSYSKADIADILENGLSLPLVGQVEAGGWKQKAILNNAPLPGAPGGSGSTAVLWQSGDPIPWWDSGLSGGPVVQGPSSVAAPTSLLGWAVGIGVTAAAVAAGWFAWKKGWIKA